MAISSLSPTETVKKGPTCRVCRELARLESEEAAALKAHLGNPAWRFTELADALFEDSGGKIDLPAHVLSRHARGQCSARDKLR